MLRDLHQEGISFFISKDVIPKQLDSPLFLTCTPENEAYSTFSVHARLCYRAPMRVKEDRSFSHFLYGCEFLNVSSEAIHLNDYLEHIKKTTTEQIKKEKLSNLVRSIFPDSVIPHE